MFATVITLQESCNIYYEIFLNELQRCITKIIKYIQLD